MSSSSAPFPKRRTAAFERGDMRSVRGGAVADQDGEGLHGPAFTYVAPHSMPLPVLIAVPHAGRVYPSETLALMRNPEHSQPRLEDRYVDRLAVEVAKQTGTGLLVAHAPRAMLDLNRAHDDVDWDMIAGPGGRRFGKPRSTLTGTNRRARSGLGLVPHRLPGFGEIWREKLQRDELERRIDCIHRPYHGFLERELLRIRDAWGAALLVDLHSMPPLRRQHNDEPIPRFVLGDRFGASCDGRLVTRAFQYFTDEGSVAAHNRPYSGGYVLDRHSSPRRGLHAMQIEVCRSLYLDDTLSQPVPALERVARMLAGLVRELGADTARIGSNDQLPQAAE